MAEAHEAGVGEEAGQIGFRFKVQGSQRSGSRGSGFYNQLTSDAGTPRTRYSSTSSIPGGSRTASNAERFPGAIVPRSSNPSAAAPSSVALRRMRAAGTPGASASYCGHLVEHVQALGAGEAVGPDCDARAAVVEPCDRRHSRTGPLVASRARYDRRAGARKLRRAPRRSTGRRGPRASRRTEQPEPLEVVRPDRNQAAATPDSTRPTRSRTSRHGPLPVCEELQLRRRFGEVDRERSIGSVRGQRRQQRQSTRNTARAARASSARDGDAGQRVELRLTGLAIAGSRLVDPEARSARRKIDSGQTAPSRAAQRSQRVRDVTDQRGSASRRLRRSPLRSPETDRRRCARRSAISAPPTPASTPRAGPARASTTARDARVR